MFIDLIGMTWFFYFLWSHDWKSAIGAAVVSRAIAFASVLNADPEALATTTLGRVGLLHLNPSNLATQVLGSGIAIYGTWLNQTEIILTGVSLILLGHVFGWSKVDKRLA